MMERIGKEAFDNKFAMDWAQEVFGDENLASPEDTAITLRTALLTVEEPTRVNRTTLCVAVAAGEIVATCLGRGRGSLPDAVSRWVSDHRGLFSYQDSYLACVALCKMTNHNPIPDEWSMSAFRQFKIYLRGLTARLDNGSMQ